MWYKPPAREGISKLNASDAMNSDIIAAIDQALPKAVIQVRQFAKNFQGENARDTAQRIWNYLKTRIRYKRDSDMWQIVRLPSVLIASGSGDCKSFSLFTAAILQALGMKAVFRYASYNGGTIPSHVYVLTEDESGRQIIIDAVYTHFNSEKPYSKKTDRQAMNVVTLSGLGAVTTWPPFPQLNTSALSGPPRQSQIRAALGLKPTATLTLYQIMNNPLQTAYNKARVENYAKAYGWVNDAWHKQGATNREAVDKWNAFVANLGPYRPYVYTEDDPRHPKNQPDTGFWDLVSNTFKAGGQLFSQVFSWIKTVTLAPGRIAFLGLVEINALSFATKLQHSNQDRLKKVWESLGGSYSALAKAITKGAGKAPVSGYGTGPIGALPLFAAAAPVIAVIVKFLNGENISTNDIIDAATKAGVALTQPASLPGAPEAGSEKETGSSMSFDAAPWLIVGVLALGYFAINHNSN